MKCKKWVVPLFLCFGLNVTSVRAAPTSTLPSNLDPSSALKELKDGNIRFMEGSANSCAGATYARTRNTNGQAPNAVVLSCSDSRVPPEQVFDQELGQLFVVRIAGNVIDEDAIASMEYAIVNLGTRLIVIMGHESCGAIEAALEIPAASDAGSVNLNYLLSQIRMNLGNMSEPVDLKLRQPVMQNVSAVAVELLQRSPIIADAIHSGQVQLEQAIYTLDSGAVDFWESSLAS